MDTTPHIADELLAEYAMGRLPTREVPALFEHLMACAECHERYEVELTFKESLREAMARTAVAVEPGRKRNWLDVFALPKTAWATAAAFALAVTFLPVLWQRSGPVQVLELTAVRGAADDEAIARTGNAVTLHLAKAGIEPRTPVTVQIADDSGREVWRGAATQTSSNWQVQPEKPFRAGRYWVRVLDPSQPDPPLREYSFLVR
jgi:hypothetical protein